MQKRYLRVRTVAELCDFTEKQLRHLCLTKKLKASKIGRTWLIDYEAFERRFRDNPDLLPEYKRHFRSV